MSEILIRAPSDLDKSVFAGLPIVVAVQGKPGSLLAEPPTVYAVVSKRALRRLWASVSTLYLWVKLDADQVRITHIGASDYEAEALDGAVIGGDTP